MMQLYGGLMPGKTFRTLVEAARTRGQILCRDKQACDRMAKQARELDLDIRPPLTTEEYFKKYRAR